MPVRILATEATRADCAEAANLISGLQADHLIADKGYDDKMGARPLGRVIQEHIKKPLAEELLFGKLAKGGVVKVGVKDDALTLKVLGTESKRLSGDRPPLLTAE